MKIKNYTSLLLGLLLVCPLLTKSQQVAFSQFYSAPLHLNPALAGISHGPRLAITYRNQWPELTSGPNGGFTTYAASFDMHVEKISGGFGIQLISDRIGNDNIVDNSVSASYSYQLRFKDKVGIKLGLSATYKNRYVNFFDLTFLDQIDPITGFTESTGINYSTNEPIPEKFARNIFNTGLGFAIFTHKYYGGISLTNLIPEKDFYDNETNRMRLVANAGALYKFGRNPYHQKLYIAPQLLYVYQNNFHQFTVGSMLGYDLIYISLWARHNINNIESVIVGVGLKKSIIRFGYSFDINASPLRGTAGSHEFTFVFNFTKEDNSLNPSYRKGRTPCPYYLDF